MRKRTVLRVGAAVAVAATMIGLAPVAYGVTSTDPPDTLASELPPPYSGWNVEATPLDGNDQIINLSFDSAALHARIENTVYLPDDYRSDGPRNPVLYLLHGTVLPAADDCALNPVTDIDTTTSMLGCHGGQRQVDFYDVPSQLSRMNFLVVAPDTGDRSVCETCGWFDGRKDATPNVPPVTARTVQMDTYMQAELYPLVEALFHAREDRGGRGVVGFSGGGGGAFVQGMVHPDRYSFISSTSGWYNIKDPILYGTIMQFGYMRDQGYGTSPVTDPAWWEQYNPMDIASNLRGVEQSLLITSGGCLNRPTSLLAEPNCQGKWTPGVRSSIGDFEINATYQAHMAARDLEAKGVPFRAEEVAGTHGANNDEVFARFIVPLANERFRAGASAPDVFDYRSAMRTFSIWGYDVSSTRSRDAMLSMTDVTADARRMTLDGIGQVQVRTPPTFEPGRSYRVTSASGGTRSDVDRTADTDGRLTYDVDLGDGQGLTQGGNRQPTRVTVSKR